MEEQIIGVLGLLLIVVAWIPETIENFKTKGKNLSLKFVAIYLAGSAFLAYHGLVLGDMVFIVINAAALLISVINAYIIISNKKA